MKRRLLIIAIFLLLGVVVNVAVAWGCAVWLSVIPSKSSVEEQSHRLVPWPLRSDLWCEVRTLRRWGAERVWIWIQRVHADHPTTRFVDPAGRLEQLTSAWAYTAALGRKSDLHANHIILDARGWPMLSLVSQTDPVRQMRERRRLPTHTMPYYLNSIDPRIPEHKRPGSLCPWFSADLAMPLGPIWPGFAINTIFYAALLWLLIPGPFALRKFLRVRRGQCFACGYDLGHAEHAACPECGASGPAITARHRR